MGGLDHGAAADRVHQPEHVSARNAKYGMVLFLIYLAFYAGFVLINTFRPQLMDLKPLAGINLAIWYGFALIVVALLLALVYSRLCRSRAGDNDPRPATRPLTGENRR
jgi:uncharacterized membrane protein (DUF485 family)